MSEVKKTKWIGPFASYSEAPAQSNFDKYYLDVQKKEVFKDSGEIDSETGEKLGVIEDKFIIKKIDIQEYLSNQLDGVGVDAYIRALSLQGEDINSYGTKVDDKIVDVSEMPTDLAGVMLAGDNAKRAFERLDPALKGDHTTIEGFLNSLDSTKLDNYIASRIEALTGVKKEVNEGDK